MTKDTPRLVDFMRIHTVLKPKGFTGYALTTMPGIEPISCPYEYARVIRCFDIDVQKVQQIRQSLLKVGYHIQQPLPTTLFIFMPMDINLLKEVKV
jgi:hypothetical protein